MTALHTQKAVRSILENARLIALHDPDWFCATVLNSPNDAWQTEAMGAVADLDRHRLGIPTQYNHDLLNRLTIRACHGPGKTHLLAKLMHWWNFTRRGRIPCTAPKEKQLITRLWPEFRKLRQNADEWYQNLITVRRTDVTWMRDPDWCAIAETASVPENLQGYHDEWLLFLADEASGIDEKMFPAMEGALTTRGTFLAMIGNPTRNEGEFYNSHMKPGTRDLYYQMHVTPDMSPRIDQRWVDNMVLKYGADSPVVQVRCMGNFVETGENQLLSLAWLTHASDVDPDYTDGSIPRVRVTVDVADGGTDESVVTVVRMFDTYTLFLAKKRFSFPSSEAPIKTAEAAMRLGDVYGADDYVVDSLGVGAGTAGYLMKAGKAVVAYKGGAASDSPKKWRNRRVQSYIALRDALRDRKVGFTSTYLEHDRDEVYAQLCSIRTVPGTERVEDLETKEALKRRVSKSPDIADGAAMVYATSVPHIGEWDAASSIAVATSNALGGQLNVAY